MPSLKSLSRLRRQHRARYRERFRRWANKAQPCMPPAEWQELLAWIRSYCPEGGGWRTYKGTLPTLMSPEWRLANMPDANMSDMLANIEKMRNEIYGVSHVPSIKSLSFAVRYGVGRSFRSVTIRQGRAHR